MELLEPQPKGSTRTQSVHHAPGPFRVPEREREKTDMAKKIRIVIEMERGEDRTYSLSLEDKNLKGDDRYVDGLTEGYETDPVEVAKTAAIVVERYLVSQIGPVFGDNRAPQDRV